MDHSLLTCIKDTKCLLLLRCGKHFHDNRPFLVIKKGYTLLGISMSVIKLFQAEISNFLCPLLAHIGN